jgi:Domain of unknown function (DUF4263)
MKLYDRDYTQLTPEESQQWAALRESEVVGRFGKFVVAKSRFRDYPRAARHILSLFPNNYLDTLELQEESRLRSTLQSFRQLIDAADVTERQVLNFIREHRAYFIVASLLKAHFTFGHHEAHLFPEFQIGNSYKADYLLVGRSSSGWHLVFVEFEAPRGDITLESGDLGAAFRKGLAQVTDWNTWLEARYGALSETFDRHRRADAPLPGEFTQLDKTRIHYIVVAGRRSDFNEKTYRTRRKKQKESSELILHYDNLLDAAEYIIGKTTY